MQCVWVALIWLGEEEHEAIMERTGKVSATTVRHDNAVMTSR